MGLISWLGDRLRAILIMSLLVGVVLLDSVSRIMSMCVDGFLAVIILVLIWPLIKSKKTTAK